MMQCNQHDIPLQIREGRLRRFYFASPCYEKKGKILVLIHGSNSAKAGQWSRQ